MTPQYDLAHLLPHTPPFRLVDRLIHADLDAGHLVAERRISADDPLYLHLPEEEGGGLPPLLLIEALAQAAACLNGLTLTATVGSAAGHRGYLVAATDFKFPDRARCGDLVELEVTRISRPTPVAVGGVSLHAFTGSARARPACQDDPGHIREIASGRLLFAVSVA